MKLTNKVYNVLKALAQVVIPAIGTLYFALNGIWGAGVLPYPKEVVGSITAFDAFLGVILSLLSSKYKAPLDGKLLVDKSNPAKDTYTFELATPFEALDKAKTVTVGVVPVNVPPAA